MWGRREAGDPLPEPSRFSGINPRANYIPTAPVPEPHNPVRTLPDEVAAVVREISDIRKAFDCSRVAGQLARVYPYLSGYENDRTYTAILIHSLLTEPESFDYERLQRIARFTGDKLAKLPAERRSFEIRAIPKTAGDRRVWFVVSRSDVIDRHNTKVMTGGIDLTNYKNNPVFLWSHDGYGSGFSTPAMDHVIGKAVDFNQTDKVLELQIEFFTGDINPKAEQAFRLVKAGGLQATSIGFIPREVMIEVQGDREIPVITRSELLECSLVSIPSNPGVGVSERGALN
jgi:HK97 family phage prohead protease